MTGAWLPILTAAVLAGVSACLAWLALRRGGLSPAGVCGCGYSLAGNETGVCPECGAPADEAFKQSERSRLLLAARRLLYWVLAVLVLGAPVTGLIVNAAGVRRYVDCSAVFVPDEKLVRQAELRWRVIKHGPGAGTGTTAGVELRLTGLDGKLETRVFSAAPGLADRARDWAVERCAGGKASAAGVRACEELGAAVERAAGGAEVLFAGVDWTLAASPMVLSEDQRMFWPMVSVLAFVGAAVWGGRRVIRMVMA